MHLSVLGASVVFLIADPSIDPEGSPNNLNPTSNKNPTFGMTTQSSVLLQQAARLERSRDSILRQMDEHKRGFSSLRQRQCFIEADIKSSLKDFTTVIDILSLQEGPNIQPTVSVSICMHFVTFST